MATTFDDFLADSAQFVFDLLPVDDKFRLARVNRRTMSMFSVECANIARQCVDEESTARLGSITMFRASYNANLGLRTAAKFGYRDLAIYLVDIRGASASCGLVGACEGRYRGIARKMVARGAMNFDHGLYTACRNNYRDLAEMMVAYGARPEIGLISACKQAYRDLGEIMLECVVERFAARINNDVLTETINARIVMNFDRAMRGAYGRGYRHLVEYMIWHGMIAANFDYDADS